MRISSFITLGIIDNIWIWLAPPLALIVLSFLAWWWTEFHTLALARFAQRLFFETAHSRAAQWLRLRFPPLRRFIGARLSPSGYLGLHLTIGMLLSGAATFAFVEIADNVEDHNKLASFDDSIVNWLHEHATPMGTTVAQTTTFLGSIAGLTILAVAVATVLAARRKPLLLLGWIAALTGGGALDLGLKMLFRRPRPVWAIPIYPRWNFSFPSGHATESVVAFGMIGYFCIVLSTFRRGVRIAIAFATLLLIGGIGFSRLYLGVHYPTDVVGGFAIGLVWLSVCVTGLEVARGYHRSRMELSGLSST